MAWQLEDDDRKDSICFKCRMRSLKRNRIFKVANIFLLVLLAIGIGIYLLSSYKMLDDFWYCAPLRPWFVDHNAKMGECGWAALREGFPMELVKQVWYNHVMSDNGRLGNLFVVFFMMLPKWVGSSIALGFWILCMMMSFRLAGISVGRSPIIAIAAFCWSFLLPWSDWMGALDYQFNYIIPSGLMIWYIWWLCNYSFNIWSYCTLIIIGLIVGAWHEGFTVPVLVGGIVMIALFKRYRNIKYFIALLSLTVGLLYLIWCPGTAIRLTGHTKVMLHSYLLIIQILVPHLAYFSLIVWYASKLIKIGLRKEDCLVLFAVVSGGTCILIQLLTTGNPRVGWWAEIISVVGLMSLFRQSSRGSWIRRRTVVAAIYSGAAILSIWHWAAVDYYALIARKEYKAVMTQYEERHERVFFTDVPSVYDLPLICRWTPNMSTFKDEWAMITFRGYYKDYETQKILSVIPQELRDATSVNGIPVPGNSGVLEKDGYFYIPTPDQWRSRFRGNMKLSTGLHGEEWFNAFPFISEGDGKSYLYLYPDDRNWKVLFGKIMYIDRLEIAYEE